MYVHHEVEWMYPSHYLAVSGVSLVYIDSETLIGVYQTTILYFPIVGDPVLAPKHTISFPLISLVSLNAHDPFEPGSK